ncbi:MAG: peptidylprolyl isomerase [Clostridiaceae bacterium]
MEDKILAIVNGNELTEGDLEYAISKFPPERRGMFSTEAGKKQLLDQMVSFELMYLYGKENNLDKEENYIAALKTAEKEILTQVAISKVLKDAEVTEEEANKYYNEHKDEFKKGALTTAKHILVDSEEKALEIKNEIDGGLSFEDAAKKYSSCPSKENGGDLGEFPRGSMVKEFENAAFSLPIGSVSSPVKTQFGYHLIFVTERKDDNASGYQDVKGTIYNNLLQQKQSQIYFGKIEELKRIYNVEIK